LNAVVATLAGNPVATLLVFQGVGGTGRAGPELSAPAKQALLLLARRQRSGIRVVYAKLRARKWRMVTPPRRPWKHQAPPQHAVGLAELRVLCLVAG